MIIVVPEKCNQKRKKKNLANLKNIFVSREKIHFRFDFTTVVFYQPYFIVNVEFPQKL